MKSSSQENILERIKNNCLSSGLTIAVAESVTSGLLQHVLSHAEDAMKFFQGGMTLYNLGQKARHLNLNPILCENCNCVSKAVSEKMATEIAIKFCSEIGIGITGFASAVPEMGIDTKMAYVAISLEGKIVASQLIKGLKPSGMKANQQHFVDKTLQLLHKCLAEKGAAAAR